MSFKSLINKVQLNKEKGPAFQVRREERCYRKEGKSTCTAIISKAKWIYMAGIKQGN